MNCKKCGSLLTENDQFCKGCGSAVTKETIVSNENIENKGNDFSSHSQPSIDGTMNTQPMSNNINVQSMNHEQPVNSNTNIQSMNHEQSVNSNTNVQPMNHEQPMSNNINVQSMNHEQPVNSNTNVQPINREQSMNNSTNVQSMSHEQPAWANSYNSQSMNNNPMSQKTNNNMMVIIIGTIIVVAILAAVIIVSVLFSNGNNSSNNVESNGSSATSTNNNSTYKVNFNGFSFKIPTDLVYETELDSIALGDEEGTWAAYIEVIEGSYNQLLSNKSQLQTIYQQEGYTASAAVEKTIGGMSFITLEISLGGYNALLGLTKANSMYVFGVTLYNLDNEYDYELLETVSKVLSSAEYTGQTANMEANNKVNMDVISELAK